ncbi:MAG: hypothetical protein RLZZ189_1995 [Pseudomonadota bacterium]
MGIYKLTNFLSSTYKLVFLGALNAMQYSELGIDATSHKAVTSLLGCDP